MNDLPMLLQYAEAHLMILEHLLQNTIAAT